MFVIVFQVAERSLIAQYRDLYYQLRMPARARARVCVCVWTGWGWGSRVLACVHEHTGARLRVLCVRERVSINSGDITSTGEKFRGRSSSN